MDVKISHKNQNCKSDKRSSITNVNMSTQCSATSANNNQASLALSMLRMSADSFMAPPRVPRKENPTPQEQRDFVIGILDEVLDILNEEDDDDFFLLAQ